MRKNKLVPVEPTPEVGHRQPATLSDDVIEAIAKKHIAIHYDTLVRAISGGDESGYQQTEQFRRIKAIINDALLFAAPVVEQEPVAWSGWGCQYPGKMPRLYGDRHIAELNCDAENGDQVLYFTAAAQPAEHQPMPEMTPWDEMDFWKMTRKEITIYAGQQNFKIAHLQAHNEQLSAKVRNQKNALRQIGKKAASLREDSRSSRRDGSLHYLEK